MSRKTVRSRSSISEMDAGFIRDWDIPPKLYRELIASPSRLATCESLDERQKRLVEILLVNMSPPDAIAADVSPEVFLLVHSGAVRDTGIVVQDSRFLQLSPGRYAEDCQDLTMGTGSLLVDLPDARLWFQFPELRKLKAHEPNVPPEGMLRKLEWIWKYYNNYDVLYIWKINWLSELGLIVPCYETLLEGLLRARRKSAILWTMGDVCLKHHTDLAEAVYFWSLAAWLEILWLNPGPEQPVGGREAFAYVLNQLGYRRTALRLRYLGRPQTQSIPDAEMLQTLNHSIQLTEKSDFREPLRQVGEQFRSILRIISQRTVKN